jgi:hypothetical protein
MSEGACIIASNSSDLDYIGLAAINARLIRKHLGLPVCLLTPDRDSHPDFDKVIAIDARPSSKRSMLKGNDHITYEWKNDHRIDAIDHSPWSRTLLLDADYIVMSDLLRPLLDCNESFMMVDSVYDITGRNSFSAMRRLPDGSVDQRWATVMCFDKSAKHVFDAAAMVRQDYGYYAAMFGFSSRPFRNDFAFSIAAHLLGVPKLPFSMAQLPPDCDVVCDRKGMKISHALNLLRWQGDLHVLNKDIAIDPSILEPLIG